jgi:hypothetical protein
MFHNTARLSVSSDAQRKMDAAVLQRKMAQKRGSKCVSNQHYFFRR